MTTKEDVGKLFSLTHHPTLFIKLSGRVSTNEASQIFISSHNHLHGNLGNSRGIGHDQAMSVCCGPPKLMHWEKP